MTKRKIAIFGHLHIEVTEGGMVAIREQGGLLAVLDMGAAIDALHRKQVAALKKGFHELAEPYTKAIRYLNEA